MNITLNPTNPRQINKDKFAKLKESIKTFPKMLELRPIIVDKEGIILGGNMRYRALQELGLEIKDEWVKVADKLTKEERRRFIVEDNLEFGEMDWDLLSTEYDADELLAWGMDEKDLQIDKEVEEDEAPEVADGEPDSKLGEIYELGRHRLMCGDSTKQADVEALMGGKKADMVFTDPPYGVSYDGGAKTVKEKLEGDENTALYNPCCEIASVFSKNAAPLYLWHAYTKAAAVAVADNGWVIRSLIIWNKNQAQYGALSAQYKQKHEPCLYCYKKGQTVNWCGPTTEVTVWDMDRASSNEFHPTQKPVGLATRAIKNHKAELVLDLFGGSGSTLIACEQTNRNCYMMELDPKYCDVIRKRYYKFIGKEEEWQNQ